LLVTKNVVFDKKLHYHGLTLLDYC